MLGLGKLGLVAALGVAATAIAASAAGQLSWGSGSAAPAAGPQTQALSAAIDEWRALQRGGATTFDGYAGFLVNHPGWPGEAAMRKAAEKLLANGNGSSPGLTVAYFRRFTPQTATGWIRFADALAAGGRTADARAAARNGWIAGNMQPADEARVMAAYAGAIAPADQDARMDALLWQGATAAAGRQLMVTGSARRPVFAARLAFRTKAPDAAARGAETAAAGANDAGWLADRTIWLRDTAQLATARTMLARPHALTGRPPDAERWFELLLQTARGAAADGQYAAAYGISRQLDDAYPTGTDVAGRPYGERDDYTSLAWLCGQTALKKLNRPADAIPCFVRYSSGSRTPQVRSKGLYWAGRAAEAAGRKDEAKGYLTGAAAFRDQFYGQLANERLGRPLTAPVNPGPRTIDPGVRAAFYNRELVRAAQLLGRTGAHEEQTLFLRAIADAASTDADHALAVELSRSIGRPDLAVMIARSAGMNNLADYTLDGFPTVPVPADAQLVWTLAQAITRQESQFDRAAVSRAGARGLMQLMPGTARDTAGKLGLPYSADRLTGDPAYNVQLGTTVIQRLYASYGSFPLAIAAYNAGPGNVNKWLAANGDPRTGAVDWLDWMEAIPITETRNYVQRVLENAVVYDLINPSRSRSSGATRLSWYIGSNKRPG